MSAPEYRPVQSRQDIDTFLDRVNGLHDGYVLSVQYTENGIRRAPDGALWSYPEKNELTVRVLVTSIWDSIVELRFTGVSDWRVRTDGMREILDTAVSFAEDGRVIWTDEYSTEEAVRREGSFVVARSMAYCFVEDNRLFTKKEATKCTTQK